MTTWRDIFDAFLRPPTWAVAVLACLGAAGLAWCIFCDGFGTPPAYVIYLVSTYALIQAVILIVRAVRPLVDRARQTRYLGAFLGDESLRSTLGGAKSVVYDLLYAGVVMFTGLANDSGWAIAVSLYHVAIAAIGLLLALGFRHAHALADDERRSYELRMVRNLGLLLFAMAAVLAGMMVMMVKDGRTWIRSDIIVIAIATFTFITLTSAIISAAKVRRVERPALVASRGIALSRALVQLFFMESIMIATFKKTDSGHELFRIAMEGTTGALVFFAVLAIALSLVLYATRGKGAARTES